MNIDPNTNLPEVASNQFWRVANHGLGWFHVELRRKRLFGSELLGYESVWTRSWDDQFSQRPEEALRMGIRNAAERLIRTRAREQAETDRAAQLVGDYPPKRLG